MLFGNDYAQIEQLSRDRLQRYDRDAEGYRLAGSGYAQKRGFPLAFSEWFGAFLLEWGRSIRERSGDATVQIARAPNRDEARHAA